jgi:MFS family permease
MYWYQPEYCPPGGWSKRRNSELSSSSLLLVIGVSPAVAGLALIPATVPIIFAGPLTGRAFERVGGRAPLVIGFLVPAASGVALGLAAPSESYPWLIPGLILQGIGLGVVLTANDPTGLTLGAQD